MISMNPTLSLSLQLEEAQAAQAKANEPVLCSRCKDSRAECSCDMCTAPFCMKCFTHKHKKAPWDVHTFTTL